MEIVLVWLGLSIAVGALAQGRGRNPVGWGLLAIVVSPVIALLFLIAAQNRAAPLVPLQHQMAATWRCPHCAEPVRVEAKLCPHCRSALPGLEPALLADFPETHNGVRYRRERDGAVVVATPQGPRRYANWGEFWRAVN